MKNERKFNVIVVNSKGKKVHLVTSDDAVVEQKSIATRLGLTKIVKETIRCTSFEITLD